ncbi:MAG: oxidoreductase [Alphaproteobacteria bacterium]|nr:MAG: oxidoreductase [Alphaproteobacteria bacterium]
MRFGVLGTGMVGTALADKLVALGHAVMMGARDKGSAKAAAWADRAGASAGDFAEAARFGEIVIFAVLGSAVLEAARLAGADNLAGKTVIDVTNPLDFSKGMPPTLIPELSGTTSAAEEIQKLLPGAHVVKALNTMNCAIMVDPARVPGAHDVFVCGDDAAAKGRVVALLQAFGWRNPVDLGDLAAARGTEGLMPFWLRLWATLGTPDFNYHIARAGR